MPAEMQQYFPEFKLTIAAANWTRSAHDCIVTLMLLYCIDGLRMRSIIKQPGVIHIAADQNPS
jgi:alkyl sulfatase BDS1-like metallo-beta-lactamase superfamily hydrolase